MRHFLLDIYFPIVCGLALFAPVGLLIVGITVNIFLAYFLPHNNTATKIFEVVIGAIMFIIYASPFIFLSLVFIISLCGSIGSFALSQTSNPLSFVPFSFSAVILYWLKKQQPLIYGFLEIVIGMSAIWFSIVTSQTTSTQVQRLITISGGVYIIVRGIDNASKQSEPVKLAYSFILDRLRIVRSRWGTSPTQ
jgi:hypothetical protein